MPVSNFYLILDLDGTLLHTSPALDAVTVPGRTRDSFLAGDTIRALTELSADYKIILATGRSWAGTKPVVDGLERNGVPMAGLVLEDGAIVGRPGSFVSSHSNHELELIRSVTNELMNGTHPEFEWQHDFQACLVARASTYTAAEILIREFRERVLTRFSWLRCYRDGRKVYLLDARVDKWTALQKLSGLKAELSVGVGDGPNDICWLSKVAYPCTLKGAPKEVIDLVRSYNGMVSTESEHKGILEVLTRLLKGEHRALSGLNL